MFEQKVVALRDEVGMLFEQSKAIGMRAAQPLVELVELHEYAGVAFVETEGALHALHCLGRVVVLVEIGQGQVAPHRGERAVERSTLFPLADSHIILALVIVETS